MNVTGFTYHFLTTAPKIETDILWDLTMVFGALGILYFGFVFFFRNRLSHRSKAVAQRKKELVPMVSTFLFSEEDDSKEEKTDYINLKIEIRELLKDKFNRIVMTEILLDLKKDVSGEARKRLFGLYEDLELHTDAFNKLKSRRWEVISKGILELTEMQVEESYGFIKKFINHRRGVLRKQAQIATVTLKNEGITYFLDTAKYRISEWQQLKLLDVIRHLKDFEPPRFKAWLTSRNRDVVLFALRLIKYYNQNDAESSIIELVKHKNPQVRTEAINCIKEFHFVEALDTLKSIFWKSNPTIKLLILDTVGELGQEKDIEFLELVEKKENNFVVKSKALSSMNTIFPGHILPTKGLVQTQPYEEMVPKLEAELAVQEKKKKRKNREKDLEEDFDRFYRDDQSVEEFHGSEIEVEEEESEKSPEILAIENLPDINSEEQVLDESLKESDELENATNTEITMEPQSLENYMDLNVDFEIVRTPDTGTAEDSEIPLQEDIDIEGPFHLIPTNLEQWEAELDPETEDLEIFDICFMEELEDILANAGDEEESYSEEDILPLHFLPIVNENSISKERERPKGQRPSPEILLMEVETEIVREDEKFKMELEAILGKIEESDEAEQDHLDTSFLPVVVDLNTALELGGFHEFDTTANDMEVICEVVLPQIADESDSSISTAEISENANREELNDEDEEDEIVELNDDTEIQPLSSKERVDHNDTNFRFSIFEELFRNCDAESKLILLDEVLAVGDEKEVHFLNSLSSDEDKKVLVKAAGIKEQLQLRLSERAEDHTEAIEALEQQQWEENAVSMDDILGEEISSQTEDPDPETTIQQSVPAEDKGQETLQPLEMCLYEESKSGDRDGLNIFEVDFELGLEESAVQTEVDQSNSVLDNLFSFPQKIIDKFNG